MHPTQPGTILSVTEALQRVPQPASDASGSDALIYDLNLPNGLSLMACVHIVYSVPLTQQVDPTSNEVMHCWLKVTRDKCTKGCCGPVMAAIQRLGRQGRMQGVPTPEGAVPLSVWRELVQSSPGGTARLRAALRGGCPGSRRATVTRPLEEHEAPLRERR